MNEDEYSDDTTNDSPKPWYVKIDDSYTFILVTKEDLSMRSYHE